MFCFDYFCLSSVNFDKPFALDLISLHIRQPTVHLGVALEYGDSSFSSPTETVAGMLSLLGAPR